MNIILSIIVPAYNMEKYIEQCLLSLLEAKQVLDKIQIIVVNDGSHDNTSRIAHKYSAIYPDVISVIDKENGNYGSAINCGLRYVKGRYFRILDSDDSFDTLALCHVVNNLLTVNDCDMVVVGYRLVNSKGQVLEIIKANNIECGKIYDATDIDIKKRKLSKCFWMHGIIYSSSIISRCNLFLQEGISYTDTEYCYYPWNSVKTIMFIDDVLYNYLVGRNGQTVSDESYLKNKNHLLRIIMRAIKEDGSLLQKGTVISSNKMCVLKNALYAYYRSVLVLSEKNDCDNINLRELDDAIRRIPVLYKITDDIKICRFFKIVKRWRKTGRYSNGVLIRFFEKIKRFVK